MVAGVRGRDGKDGRDGKAIKGERGKDGRDGINGEKGEAIKGERGLNGGKGERGINGGKGERGINGRDGKDGRDAISEKLEESFFLLPSQFSQQEKRTSSELNLNLFRVKEGGKLRKRSQNKHLSDDVLKVWKECPSGMKLFNGFCKWNLLQFMEKESWCLAEDFQVKKRGCSDCFTSIETKLIEFEGKKRQVVTSLTYSDRQKQEQPFELTERSCLLLDTSALQKLERKKCGFFCLFQKLDPIFESDTKFSCTYFPPASFGVDDSSPLFSSFNLSNKLNIISVEIVCS